MPKITFVSATGEEHQVEVAEGTTAMEAAVQNMVAGIDGDCGGVAACGTCHVYVDGPWFAKTGPAAAGIEKDMLSLTDNATDNSRLACQLKITKELDGLVLRMPAGQH